MWLVLCAKRIDINRPPWTQEAFVPIFSLPLVSSINAKKDRTEIIEQSGEQRYILKYQENPRIIIDFDLSFNVK